MAITKTPIQPVQQGEVVSPTNTNRPILELEQNVDSILSYINGGSWDGGTFTSDVTINGVLSVTGQGQLINLSSNANADAHINFGDPAAGWLIKYVGTTAGTGGNEFAVLSNAYGPGGFQIDHDGNFEIITGSGTHKAWHSGNDGAGSTLNADMVDDLHASQFLRSDTADVFTSLTGTKLWLGGSEITGQTTSGASLQVNGFMRTGTIFMHDVGAGNNPLADNMDFKNVGGALKWGASTIWHSGNDGAGSTLDADTVDGLQASQFLRSDATDSMSGSLTVNGNLTTTGSFSANYIQFTSAKTLVSGTDLNTVTTSGFYDVSGPVNGPGSGWWYVEVIRHASNNGHVLQKATVLNGANGSTYFRTETGGSWGTWQKVWTSINDGAGSTLDADLVDGLQASQFVRSDTADTKTGQLQINWSGPTIGGSNLNNAWLLVGDATTGWGMDPNELYAGTNGIIGSINGYLSIQPATELRVTKDVIMTTNATQYTNSGRTAGVKVEYNATSNALEFNFF